jgi:Protein of unknown function (DUF1460)
MSSSHSASWILVLNFCLFLNGCSFPQQKLPFASIPAPLPFKPNIPLSISSVSLPSNEKEEFLRVMQTANQQHLQSRPLGEVIAAIAQQFLGTPYQAELLEHSPTEHLFLSLKRFDCVLLVETVVALAHNVVRHDDSVSTFAKNVESLRYRSGHLDGYCSRLHYFSDWIADNEKRGLVENLTAKLGGTVLPQTFNFMSTHRSLYPQLKSDTEFQCLKQVEAHLNQSSLTFIPTTGIRNLYPQLRSGDIIAVVTGVPGLDVTHTGLIARRGNDSIGIIHASPRGAVQRDLDLQTYVTRVPMSKGIFVVRPF